MKNYLFNLLIAFLVFPVFCQAQTPSSWRVGFGISPGVPTTNLFRYTLGADVRVQKSFNETFSGTFTAGFTHFFEKDHFANYTQYGSPYNVIPVKAGIKAFLSGNFYLAGEAGVGLGFEQWGNSFLYSPSVGIALKNGLDVSVKYEDFTRNKNTKDISLRLAYGLDVKKTTSHKRDNTDNEWLMNVSINPGLTTNSFENFVLGGELGLNRKLNNDLEVSVSGGYSHFFINEKNYIVYPAKSDIYDITSSASQNVIPVKAGLRFYAGNQFYIAGDAGVGFANHGNTSFVYSPSAGFVSQNGLDIGIKYEDYNSPYVSDQVAIKLGYRFKL